MDQSTDRSNVRETAWPWRDIEHLHKSCVNTMESHKGNGASNYQQLDCLFNNNHHIHQHHHRYGRRRLPPHHPVLTSFKIQSGAVITRFNILWTYIKQLPLMKRNIHKNYTPCPSEDFKEIWARFIRIILHDDVIKWKHFPPFVREIHRSPDKGQWRGALMFSLICDWINDWVNNREASDWRRHRVHYDGTLMS